MKSIDFQNSNNILPTPAGNMPVFIGAQGEIVSKWKFTWKELWQTIKNKRTVFVVQFPQSIAFPELEMGFRELTAKEKEEMQKKQRQQHVAQNRNRRSQLIKR